MDQSSGSRNGAASSGWFRVVSTSIRGQRLLGMFVVAVSSRLVLGAAVYLKRNPRISR